MLVYRSVGSWPSHCLQSFENPSKRMVFFSPSLFPSPSTKLPPWTPKPTFLEVFMVFLTWFLGGHFSLGISMGCWGPKMAASHPNLAVSTQVTSAKDYWNPSMTPPDEADEWHKSEVFWMGEVVRGQNEMKTYMLLFSLFLSCTNINVRI